MLACGHLKDWIEIARSFKRAMLHLCNFYFDASWAKDWACGPTQLTHARTHTRSRPTLAAGEIFCVWSQQLITNWQKTINAQVSEDRDEACDSGTVSTQCFPSANMRTLLQLAFRCEKTVLHKTTFSWARKTCNFQLRNGNGRKSNVIDRFWSVWVDWLCFFASIQWDWKTWHSICIPLELRGCMKGNVRDLKEVETLTMRCKGNCRVIWQLSLIMYDKMHWKSPKSLALNIPKQTKLEMFGIRALDSRTKRRSFTSIPRRLSFEITLRCLKQRLACV